MSDRPTPPTAAPTALDEHALDVGDRVDVALLVPVTRPSTGHDVPLTVAGTVAAATTSVLVLAHDDGTVIRIPWTSVATITTTTTPVHPGI